MAGIIEKYYDNSTENLGNKDSFIWYGPRWASAGTAPSRGTKGSTLEGGIRCPCIVRFPPLQPKANAGSISSSFTTVMDVLPTVLDLAGVPHPGKTYRGREVVLPKGKSWKTHLVSPEQPVHDQETHVHGWELFGQRAIRQGDWKAVWLTTSSREGWELYNIAHDPAELEDLGEKHPEILDGLVEFWDQYVSETGMVPTPMWTKPS